MKYVSPFTINGEDRWGAQAMVRAGQRSLTWPEFQEDERLFSTELTPYLEHPKVRSLGLSAARALGAQRLADYLAKTEIVEIDIVNRAVEYIFSLPGLPEDVRMDVLKIYTDEGYHVLMMAEFRDGINNAIGTDLERRRIPEIESIIGIIRALPESQRGLGYLCCATVTETLITASLRQAGDERLYPPVGRVLKEHASDEMRHQAFFTRFAQAYIPTLDEESQSLIEWLYPLMMWLFLCPSFSQLRSDLIAAGLAADHVEQIMEESFDRAQLQQQFLSASTATRQLFSRLGFSRANFFDERILELRHLPLVLLEKIQENRDVEIR